jgi:hypothetical protein
LVVQVKKGGEFGLFMDRGGIKGNEQGIKCTGNCYNLLEFAKIDKYQML